MGAKRRPRSSSAPRGRTAKVQTTVSAVDVNVKRSTSRSKDSKKTQPVEVLGRDYDWWLDFMEMCSWMLTSATFGLWYNGVGTIASWRGVDYASIIATSLDQKLPVVEQLILPYIWAYFMPFVYVVCAVKGKGVRQALANVRLFYAVQMGLMGTCYALYVLFPTSIATLHWAQPPATAPALLHLTHSFVHAGMTSFNACPSMHVAHCVSIAWIQSADKLPYAHWSSAFAVITLFSTFLTKAHFLADVPAGLALAQLFDMHVYRPCASSGTFANAKTKAAKKMSEAARVALICSAPALMLVGMVTITVYTGANVNPATMFQG